MTSSEETHREEHIAVPCRAVPRHGIVARRPTENASLSVVRNDLQFPGIESHDDGARTELCHFEQSQEEAI